MEIRLPSTTTVHLLLLSLALPTLSLAGGKLEIPSAFEPFGNHYVARTHRGSVVIRDDGFSLNAAGSAAEFRWTGAARGPLRAKQPTGGVTNYLTGSDPAQWRAGVPQYAHVERHRLYAGIDLAYYFKGSLLEFDLIVNPGADARQARLMESSGRHPESQRDGSLTFGTAHRFHRPIAYQMVNGKRVEVACDYRIERDGGIRFRIGDYDRTRELVIDPVVEYMTYLGGSGIDRIQAVGVDSAGNAVLAGVTTSPNFPGAPAGTERAISLFVTKLNATGSAVLFTTMLGLYTTSSYTSVRDRVISLALDSDGAIYFIGAAYAYNFPTSANAWQRSSQGAFAAKIDAAGKLVYSSYLGPQAWWLDPRRIAVHNGIAYIAGNASRAEFLGTPGALQRDLAGGRDTFALALTADGSGPVFVTALGGSGEDTFSDMALDANGDLICTGVTQSADFPHTSDALPYPAVTTYPGTAFVARINSAGSTLLYSTFLGTPNANGVAVTPGGDYVIAGTYELPAGFGSTAPHHVIQFPTGARSGYIAKFSSATNRPIWTTDIQPGISPYGFGITSDQQGDLYLPGYCQWPGGGSLMPDHDAGLVKLSADGSRLLYCTPLQGGYQLSVAAGTGGRVLAAGWTNQSDLPVTPGVVQSQRDPAEAGYFNRPLNYDDGLAGVLDLSGFTSGNFYLAPPQSGIGWRIGEPAPQLLTIPVLLSGDPGTITVSTTSNRIVPTYVSVPSPAVQIAPNLAQTQDGIFTESITVQASHPDARLTVPVGIQVLPKIRIDPAQTQIEVHRRCGQGTYGYQTQTVAFTVTPAEAGLRFEAVSSNQKAFYGSIQTVDAGHFTLTAVFLDLESGTYDGTFTVRAKGIQNTEAVLHVHYVLDPPAVVELSTKSVNLHVVRGQPAPSASISVTSGVSGVQWRRIGSYQSWVLVSDTGMTTPSEIRITVNPETADVGTFTFSLLVEDEIRRTQTITINVDVSSGSAFDILPKSISYELVRGSQYPPPAPTLTMTAPTPTKVDLSVDQPWAILSSTSGTTPFVVSLRFDTSLTEGVRQATLTARAGGSVQTIPLTWKFYDSTSLEFPSTPIKFRHQIGGPLPTAQQIRITCPTIRSVSWMAGTTKWPDFLTVTPLYGNTPATLTLTVDVTGLTPGTYASGVYIQARHPDRIDYPAIPVTLEIVANPNVPAASIARAVNAASYLGATVSPGEILTIFGTSIGPAILVQAQPDGDGHYPATLSGATFYFDDIPAPIVYVSSGQSAVVAPFGIAGKAKTQLTFATEGKRTVPVELTVSDTNPGIFTANAAGNGVPAAHNVASDGSLSLHAGTNPVARGGIVTLYATGLGVTSPALADGSLAGLPLAKLSSPIHVFVGGYEAGVLYAGPAPGLIAGMMQINIRVPESVTPGNAALLVVAGQNPSQPGVTLAVK